MLPLVISSSPFFLPILLMYFMFYLFAWWIEQCWIHIFGSFQKFNIWYLFQGLLCRTWKNSALNNKKNPNKPHLELVALKSDITGGTIVVE